MVLLTFGEFSVYMRRKRSQPSDPDFRILPSRPSWNSWVSCTTRYCWFPWSNKQKAIAKLGVSATLGELANKSKGTLISAVGKSTGETLYNAVRGIDVIKLESVNSKPRKSVSCEIDVFFLFYLRWFYDWISLYPHLVRDTFWEQWTGRGFYSLDGQWS